MTFLKPFMAIFFLGLIATNGFAQDTEEEKRVFINNEATVNSDQLDYSPAFYEDGIVFISSKVSDKKYKVTDKRIGENVMSIFQSRREENGLLLPPVPFARELLTTVHEGPLTFDRTAENLFFSRNNIKKGKKIKAKDGYVKMKIYRAELVGGKWSNVEDLPFNDDEFNSMHPAISVEGDIIYFSSDRPDGIGGMDIWMVKKMGDTWSEPFNAGPTINTEANEVFPFIHADGTLFFASNGLPGFGGLDIFFTNNNNDIWDKPTNLSAPFNSENDDLGFIIDRDKKNGYFSSNRDGGYGQDDIYSYYISGGLDGLFDKDNRPKVVRSFVIAVSDPVSGEMVEGTTVTYTNLDNLSITNAIANGANMNEILTQLSDPTNADLLLRVPMDKNSISGTTDNLGKFPVDLSTGNYAFVIEKAGYHPRQILLDTETSSEELFVSLDPITAADLAGNNGSTNPNGNNGTTVTGESTGTGINGSTGSTTVNDKTTGNTGSGFSSTIKEGTVFQLPNIYYNFNDAAIRKDARVDLDALADFMAQYADVSIELSSHTDARGGSRYNKRLSQKRAENAVAYLIRKGISSDRLVAVGYGEEQIRNSCTNGKTCTEDEHQYNRRTAVRITKMSQEINIQFVNDTAPPAYTDSAEDYSGGSFVENPRYVGALDDNTNSTGEYIVIAGVYANYANAEKKLNRLINKGFGQTEIKTEGTYYHIIVNRFSDRNEALNLQASLTDNQIKSFLKE